MSKEEERAKKKEKSPASKIDGKKARTAIQKGKVEKTDQTINGTKKKTIAGSAPNYKDRSNDASKKDRKQIIHKNNSSRSNNYTQAKNKSNRTDDLPLNEKAGVADRSSKNSKSIDSTFKRRSQKRPETRKISKEQGGCPNIRQCGSCQMMQVSYPEHLKEKQKTVDNLIKKYCKVDPIIGMNNPYHYRNKVHVVFDHDRKGNPISGIYEEHTHHVIPIEGCFIHNEKADEIINSIRGMLRSFKIKTYDEDTGYGLLRHVLVRTGFQSGEIMVVLIAASPIFPSKNNFVKALRKLHPEITTIVLNVNNKKTSMVLGDKEYVIYGKGYIEDTLCGKVFRISPKSFYQVNPAQTEVLYSKAIEFAELAGKETVIDAYCGIGTIGLAASDHAGKVISVELNKDAVMDARINAKRNQVKNADFYNNDAGEFMSQMASQKETADVVFMDPPRAGSDEKFLNSLVQLKPKRVVYISCNPVTLERDICYLSKRGYKAVKAVPVDMFPWTGHVETVVLLTRKSAVDYNVEIKINL